MVIKNNTMDGYTYKRCYCPGQIYIARVPRNLEDFCNIFLPNTGEDQKHSWHLSAGPLALYHMVNASLAVELHSLKN